MQSAVRAESILCAVKAEAEKIDVIMQADFARLQSKVDQLLLDAKANGGLAPVDTVQFWQDQEAAQADPFGQDIPQVPLGAMYWGVRCSHGRGCWMRKQG